MPTRRASPGDLRAVLALSLVICACATPASVPGADAGEDSGPSTRAITLDLRDATVEEVLLAVSRAAEQSIVIDPDAQAVARCARMSVLAPKPTSGDELARLVADALAPSSLDLAVTPGGWIVRKKAGAPPPASCMSPRAQDTAVLPDDPPAAASAAGDPPELERILAGIKRVSDREVHVTTSARDAFFANVAAATARVRLLPNVRDGGLAGLKLFGIRPGDVVAALGFENGDTLIALEKQPIGDPALAVSPEVRRSKRLTFQIERRGKPREIVVQIVRDPKPAPSAH